MTDSVGYEVPLMEISTMKEGRNDEVECVMTLLIFLSNDAGIKCYSSD